MRNDYDVIIIGTGAGGGTLAHRLAPSGKRILLLERGGYLPREPENWDSKAVFLDGHYLPDEEWMDKGGTRFRPHQQYFVGGNTKFYGAILFRLRERDFGEIRHRGGVSPAWPISYEDLAPYYDEAEALYHVHGERGEDPTEPPTAGPYPWPAYTLGITAGLRGGVEFPGHVMQGPGTIGRTTSHEVAHQWFYALVGNDQGRDPWIDEALATFAEWCFEGTLDAMRSRAIPVSVRGRAGEPMR